MTFEDALRHWTASFCQVTDDQVAVLRRHYDLLVRWNRRLNLTSVVDPAEAAKKHYAESLFLAIHLPPDARNIADIGSGAGFPGFPVAAFRPDARLTLVESDIRKSVFLQECRDVLPNLRIVNSRAESLPAASFDLLISRAVNLDEVAALVPSLAPAAYSLASCEASRGGFTWNEVAPLPWATDSCVVSRGTAKL
jgi:16S rRNA (guanine(527)-N(7))-methyltransferase RsmG